MSVNGKSKKKKSKKKNKTHDLVYRPPVKKRELPTIFLTKKIESNMIRFMEEMREETFILGMYSSNQRGVTVMRNFIKTYTDAYNNMVEDKEDRYCLSGTPTTTELHFHNSLIRITTNFDDYYAYDAIVVDRTLPYAIKSIFCRKDKWIKRRVRPINVYDNSVKGAPTTLNLSARKFFCQTPQHYKGHQHTDRYQKIHSLIPNKLPEENNEQQGSGDGTVETIGTNKSSDK